MVLDRYWRWTLLPSPVTGGGDEIEPRHWILLNQSGQNCCTWNKISPNISARLLRLLLGWYLEIA
jgi:hypothetical protein